jgi:hypothetical protein
MYPRSNVWNKSQQMKQHQQTKDPIRQKENSNLGYISKVVNLCAKPI